MMKLCFPVINMSKQTSFPFMEINNQLQGNCGEAASEFTSRRKHFAVLKVLEVVAE